MHIWNLCGPIQVNRGNGSSRKQKSHKRRRECTIRLKSTFLKKSIRVLGKVPKLCTFFHILAQCPPHRPLMLVLQHSRFEKGFIEQTSSALFKTSEFWKAKKKNPKATFALPDNKY